MRRLVLRFAVLAHLLALPGQAQEAVSYRLSYPRPDLPYVEVELELARARPGPLTLVMPRAVPMGYGEQPYDRFVGAMRAFSDEGEPVGVTREPEGPRWSLGSPESRVARVTYRVDVRAMEAAIRSAADASKLRPDYAGFLGYSVFAYFEGHEDQPIRLGIDAPEGWSVFSTLSPKVPAPRGRTAVEASDFYALADSQIVLGREARILRPDGEVPLFLIVYAEGSVDEGLIGQLVGEAMTRVAAYFGEAPLAHYTVHMELLRPVSAEHDYGFSMEHLDSATFYLDASRGLSAASPPRALRIALYNFAHHFAHAWIPKRAYGKGYFPFTWELAPVLDTIWFSEGFAQYAALEALADGMPEPEGDEYRRALLDFRFASTLREAPEFIRRMSLVELSRVASTRYSQDFRTGRNVFSRGALMAAEMDEAIRAATDGSHRLRDALRHLMAWSYENRRPFEIGELSGIFEEATGVDVGPILKRWLDPPGGSKERNDRDESVDVP